MYDKDYQQLYRFSKKVGVPQDQLDHVLVELLSQGSQGSYKNLKMLYNTLDKFRVLRDEAVKHNVSFQEMLEIIRSHKNNS